MEEHRVLWPVGVGAVGSNPRPGENINSQPVYGKHHQET